MRRAPIAPSDISVSTFVRSSGSYITSTGVVIIANLSFSNAYLQLSVKVIRYPSRFSFFVRLVSSAAIFEKSLMNLR